MEKNPEEQTADRMLSLIHILEQKDKIKMNEALDVMYDVLSYKGKQLSLDSIGVQKTDVRVPGIPEDNKDVYKRQEPTREILRATKRRAADPRLRQGTISVSYTHLAIHLRILRLGMCMMKI